MNDTPNLLSMISQSNRNQRILQVALVESRVSCIDIVLQKLPCLPLFCTPSGVILPRMHSSNWDNKEVWTLRAAHDRCYRINRECIDMSERNVLGFRPWPKQAAVRLNQFPCL